MAEVLFALLEKGVIGNVIVVEAADHPFPQEYIADDGNPYDEAVRVDAMDPRPGIGWVKKADGTFAPQYVLVADVTSIPADGKTVATVTYTDNTASPPASITFDVNGVKTDAALINGSASIAVTSTSPGDLITVTAGTTGITISVGA